MSLASFSINTVNNTAEAEFVWTGGGPDFGRVSVTVHAFPPSGGTDSLKERERAFLMAMRARLNGALAEIEEKLSR